MTQINKGVTSITDRRARMKYKISTTGTTGSGVVPIRGGENYPAEPSIFFTREAWVKQCHLVDKCTKEVGWFALVDHDATDNSFTITELVIPTQTVTAAETDISKEQLADAAMTLIEQGKDTSKLYAWFHSHVNMGVAPSAQDEFQVEDFLEDLADQPGIPAFIRGIQNKNGDLKLDVYYVQHGIAYQNVKFYVLYDDDPQWCKDIDALIKANVKEYIPPTYYGGGHQQSMGKYQRGRAGTGAGTGKSDDFGYTRGLRHGYPYWDVEAGMYVHDDYDDVYDIAIPKNDALPQLPLPVSMSTVDKYDMEVLYNGAGNVEVMYDEKTNKLWVCDAIGDMYNYDEYTEAHGDFGIDSMTMLKA